MQQKLSVIAGLLALAVLGLVFALSSSPVAAGPAPQPNGPEIVGGQEADPGEWPWQVALIDAGGDTYWDQFCGGSLIDKMWVVTAAHCVYPNTQPGDIEVLAGIHNLKSPDAGYQRLAVSKIIMHPQYNHPSHDYDIALLKLTKPATFGPNRADALAVGAIGLVAPDAGAFDGVTATVTGWGNILSSGTNYPDKLQEVEVPVITNAACNQSYGGKITDRMLCAGFKSGGKDSCQGDSGGPLVIFDQTRSKWMLAGIVSWGTGCALPNFYGVYGRVTEFNQWVMDQTGLGQEGPFEVVADGLNNPRHLTFDEDGALYVAEAGFGGDSPCVNGPEGNVCLGPSGSVTRVVGDSQTRITDDLYSLAHPEDGSSAIGPHDVALDGDGNLFAVVGLGANPASRGQGKPLGANGLNLGQLAQVNPNGSWNNVVDVAGYEGTNNPDEGEPDSNPYGVLAVEDGFVVADAGGNDLVHINDEGTITTLAVFPDRMVEFPPNSGQEIPMQAVPTSVVVGPDGDYYVGQLTGFPFPAGGANVYRVPAGGGQPQVYAGGFTTIVDLSFDEWGNLYVLEIDDNGLATDGGTGRLIRLNKDGSRETIAANGLVMPGGVEVGPDGKIYVSNFSVMKGLGQVVRLDAIWQVYLPAVLR